ncbi:DoxX family protein [Chitinophaga silvatica]|uniref:DoxX family protein n=1 Tax=Chitinophaga silvatica TaxID=2282649 RepID=A0A3E1Y931_9BACT|nr:DoxX family protein [Chitinophaga silvatica]RFS21900.1 DoxX family protein [Chitinophaga silvatica]
MIRKMLTAKVNAENWLILIRIIAGLLIMVHGMGTFNPIHMKGNIDWLTDLHFPAPTFMAYLGKGSEFIGGILLILGLLTRFAATVLVINMSVITFIMGSGKIFTEDQPPFLLLILFVYLLIMGGGNYSLDKILLDKSSK